MCIHQLCVCGEYVGLIHEEFHSLQRISLRTCTIGLTLCNQQEGTTEKVTCLIHTMNKIQQILTKIITIRSKCRKKKNTERNYDKK